MIQYWRQIAVALFTLAMVVAPSNDPGTMLALAIPLTLLFFASIGLVKMVEPKGAAGVAPVSAKTPVSPFPARIPVFPTGRPRPLGSVCG